MTAVVFKLAQLAATAATFGASGDVTAAVFQQRFCHVITNGGHGKFLELFTKTIAIIIILTAARFRPGKVTASNDVTRASSRAIVFRGVNA